MDTTLDDVQLAVQETFGRFFEKESTPEVVRAAEPLGFDRALWQRLVGIGALEMAMPERDGGTDAGVTCLVLVAEQLGRTLAPVPLIDSIVAARAIARSASAEARGVLSAALEGSELVVWSPRPILGGVARLVPSGAVADRVVAMDGDRLVLATIQAGRTVRRNLGSMPIADCPTGDSIVLAEGDDAQATFTQATIEWKALTAAALAGLGARSFEIALEYVKVRKAFGTLIGMFQTVSHRLADDVVDLDGARLISYEAGWSIDEGRDDAATIASMAFIFASEVAVRCSGDSLHFHGGVGFTMEHDIQLYYRRAAGWSQVYRRLDDEYQHLADLLYGPPRQTESGTDTEKGR